MGFMALMFGLAILSMYSDHLFKTYLFEALPAEGVDRNTELAVGSTSATLLYAVIAPFFGMLVDRTSLGKAFCVVAAVSAVLCSASYVLFSRVARL